MKVHLHSGVSVFVQIALFYIVPLFMKSLGPIGMVFLLLIGTFINFLILGILSGKNDKFLCPALISIIFIPSVFIFYNASALMHALWYFVISSVGLLVGAGLRKLLH